MNLAVLCLWSMVALPAVSLVGDLRPASAGAEAPLPAGAVMRLGETRLRPGARIRYLAFSPDGKRLASWGNWLYFEDRVSVWDVATGKEVFTQRFDECRIVDLCWGPRGAFAAVNAKTDMRLWKCAEASGSAPQATSESPAPGFVAKPLACERLAFAADGSRLATFRSEAGGAAGDVDLFELPAGGEGTDLKRLASRKLVLQEKCSGLRLACGGKRVVVLARGQQVLVVWDTARDSVSDPVVVPQPVPQGQTLDVAEDGSAVAVGLADGTVQVFDLPSGKRRLSVLKHNQPKQGRGWPELSAVKFVNGSRNILSAGRDNRQLVWDARTGAEVRALDGHASWVEAVAVSGDGKRVATAGQDSLIRLWDAATWQPLLAPQGPQAEIWRLEASRDGRHAAAYSSDGVHVWDLAPGQEVRSVASSDGGGDVLFAPEGGVLIGDPEGGLALYPLPTGAPKALPARGRLLDFTPDGKMLLTAHGNNVLVLDWPSCTQRLAVAFKGPPTSASITPNGTTAVVQASGAESASILDLKSGQIRPIGCKLHWFARAAGFTPDGRTVCATVGSPRAEAWSLVSRSRLWQFEQPPARPPGHFYQLSFAVSPNGRWAATSHSDGGVAVYEMATGQMVAHFQGHRDSVIALAWTADGRRLLSGGGDHQVLVWDVSLRTLAGKPEALPAAERLKAWDRLASPSAKEAMRTMAALAADPETAVAVVADKLNPVTEVAPEILDRIFRDLADDKFSIRARATRELNKLGAGAVHGVRQRADRSSSAEVRQRAEDFLRRFDGAAWTPERIRISRALEVLASANTPTARTVVGRLAAGAPDVWETETARQTLRQMGRGRQ